MSSVFRGCSSLISLNLSNFNTNNVKDISYMFFGCSSLTSLNLSNFNTNNVIAMNHMFYSISKNCKINHNENGISTELNNTFSDCYLF